MRTPLGEHALDSRLQQLVLEHVEASIGVYNTKFEPLYVSPSIERITGYSIDEFFTLSIADQVHPDDVEHVTTSIQKLLDNPGEQIREEYRVFHKDGSVHWIQGYANSIGKPHSNEVEFIVGITYDITERKEYEKQLNESEERLKLITENASDILSLQNAKGETTYISPVCEQILGYSPNEIMEGIPESFIHPDDIDRLAKAQENLLKNPAHSGMTEHRLRHKDGYYVWVEATAQTILDPDTQQVQSIIGITRDISERKQVEEELYQQQSMFKLISENTTDIIAVLDANNVVQFVTPSVQNIIGYTPEEVLEFSLWQGIHPEDKEKLSQLGVTKRTKQGEAVKHRYRRLHKDGYYVHLEGIVSAIFSKETQEVISRVSVTRDITDQIRREANLRREQLHLNLLAEQATDLLTTCTPDGLLSYVSPSVEQLLGYDPEKLKRTPFVYLLHNDDKIEWIDKYLKNFSEPRHVIRFEHRIRNNAGDYIWFETYTHSLMDTDNGVIEGLATISRDITDRKRIAIRLKQSEARLRSLIDSPTDSIFLLDQDGNILELNNTTAKRLYTKRSNLIGKNVFDFVTAREKALLRRLLENIYNQKVQNPFEIEYNGAWYSVVINFVDGSGNAPSNIAMIARDITARKNLEIRIQEQEALYRMLADYATDIISRNLPDGTVKYISPATETILGYSPNEIEGNNISDLVYPKDLPAITEMYQSILEEPASSDNISRVEFRIRHKEGHLIWLEGSGQAVRNTNSGAIEYVIGISRDITQQKIAEQESNQNLEHKLTIMRERSQTLRQLARTLKRAIESLTPTESLSRYQESSIKNDKSHHLVEIVKVSNQLIDLITQLTSR